MSKQVRTIASIASRIACATDKAESLSDELRAIRLDVAGWNADDKRVLDAECVAYVATTRGLTIKERDSNKGKVKPYWSRMVIVGERTAEGKATDAYNRANVALNRARGVVFAVEEGRLTFDKKAGEWKETRAPAKARPAASNESVFDKLEAMAALAIKGHDKAQIKALKQRVTAIMLMLSA